MVSEGLSPVAIPLTKTSSSGSIAVGAVGGSTRMGSLRLRQNRYRWRRPTELQTNPIGRDRCFVQEHSQMSGAVSDVAIHRIIRPHSPVRELVRAAAAAQLIVMGASDRTECPSRPLDS